MNNSINIALDIETLSTRPTAAIISIAAKQFSFDSDKQITKTDFHCQIDVTSCAMYGMHFDNNTVDWWFRQSVLAKEPYIKGVGCVIKDALILLEDWVTSIRSASPDDSINVWMQGTDFDAAILRNAYCAVFGDDSRMPWKHYELRDSRTFITSVINTYRPELKNPYDDIPKNTKWVKHDVMSDVDNLIWNVKYVHQTLTKLIPIVQLGKTPL